MLRDNKQFRERFQRWKNGEQVYDSGRPIDSYEVGKDPVADAIYDQEVQQASRNNYIRWGFDSAEDAYRRIMNGQAPRPKFNDTITNDTVVDHYEGGKDSSEELVYPGKTLPEVVVNGYAPIRLTTYYPIVSKYPWTGHSKLDIPIQRDVWENYTGENSDEIASDRSAPYMIIDKQSQAKDYNFVTNNCADATLGYLNKAFRTKETPLLFTTPGDVRDFALKKLHGKLIKNDDGSDTVLIPRNAKNAKRLSKSALDMYENDMAGTSFLSYKSRFKDGRDAKSRLTNALIGMAVADNPAVMTASGWKQDKNGNWTQKRTKEDEQLGKNLAVLSTMSPTHPLSAAIGGAINKLSNLARIRQVYGMQLNGIKLTKSSTQKLFDDLITGNITPEAMAYIPQGLRATTTKVPSEVYQSVANSTIPRMIRHRPYMKAEDLARSIDNTFARSKYAEFLPEVYEAAGQSGYGGFYNPNKHFISIKAGRTAPYARPHEVRHMIDDAEPMLQSEEDLVNSIFNKHFVDKEVEKLPTVGDARRRLLGLENDLYMPWTEQNEIVDFASDNEIINAFEKANAYGGRYIENLRKVYGQVPPNIIKAMREGMKYLGVGAGVGLNVPTTFDARQYKNGKDGIYIKPKNRGKFTALKKRTGHSASWFKAHGTPAQKKMAVFALNARKWKH